MEKDSGEVRRMKAKAMAAPPWVIKTTIPSSPGPARQQG
jgi:hypothetical protein